MKLKYKMIALPLAAVSLIYVAIFFASNLTGKLSHPYSVSSAVEVQFRELYNIWSSYASNGGRSRNPMRLEDLVGYGFLPEMLEVENRATEEIITIRFVRTSSFRVNPENTDERLIFICRTPVEVSFRDEKTSELKRHLRYIGITNFGNIVRLESIPEKMLPSE